MKASAPLGDFDVVVIGAGIVGTMIARELARHTGRFALLDKEPFPGFGVSKASLAQVHLPDFCPPGSLKGRLCRDAPGAFKRMAAELDVPYREVDELWLAFEPGHVADLEAARARGESQGGRGYTLIGPQTIRRLEPLVTQEAVAGLHAPGAGVIHPTEWAFALAENAAQNGVRVLTNCRVNGIESLASGGYRIATSRGSLHAAFIVNAAGLFVDEIARMVGDDHFRLAMRRGTMVIFDKQSAQRVSHMIFGTFGPTHSQDIAPTVHGNLILGVHYDPVEHKGDTRVSRESVRRVLELGCRMVPSLSEADIITSFAGILAANARSPEGDFHIAESPRAPGIIHLVLGAPALTAAPGIAQHVLKMLAQAGFPARLRPDFQPRRTSWPRFQEAAPAAKRCLVGRNPEYGRILCRCEQVTEAEVREAVRRGADTLDAVKHVTRAGMGRCQGGFCGPAVVKVLARMLDVPLTAITKKGKGSAWISGSAGGRRLREDRPPC